MGGVAWLWDKIASVVNTGVEVFIVGLLLALFIGFILHLRKDKPFWGIIKHWALASIGSVIIILVCLLVSPDVLPESDSLGLYRHLLLRAASFLLGMVMLGGAILWFDAIFPANLVQKIEDAPYGPTIFMSAVVLALSALLCYT